MIDNRERAYFIVSLGSMNNYGSTLAATKRALDQGRPDELDGAGDDRGKQAARLATRKVKPLFGNIKN